MKKLLIKNGNIVFDKTIEKQDILIYKNKIKDIQKSIDPPANCKIIDASNKYILPAGIDVHTHMDLEVWKGMVSSDDYFTGSRAALNGGITTYFGFAYQKKNQTLLSAYNSELKKINGKSLCDYKLHIGITNLQKDYDSQIKKCIARGIKTFKIHLNDPAVDTVFLYKVFKSIARYNGIAVIHCEDGRLVEFLKKEYIKSGKKGIIYHPKTRENYIEKIAIDTVIDIATALNTKIYIVHVSTAEGVESIKKAKQEGKIWIEAETCPQYLLFTESKYKSKNGFLYSCSPSFKSKFDRDALWAALKKGILKVVSSDHCPFTVKQKLTGKNNFTKLPYGMPGVETTYHLLLSEGLKRGFKLNDIVKLISTNPAKIFGLYPHKGVIKKNSSADIIIYNRTKSFKLKSKDLLTNCDYSPYEEIAVKGKIETVIVQGRIAVENEKFVL